MARRSERDYEVVIPVRIRDETERGSRSVNSNVDKMAQQAARGAERQKKSGFTALEQMERRVAESNRKYFAALEERKRIEERNNKAVASLDKQRQTALYRQWAEDTRRHEREQREQTRATDRAVKEQTKANERSARERARLYQQERREQQRIMDRALREFERNKKQEEQTAKRAVDAQIRELKRLEKEEAAAANRRVAYAKKMAVEQERASQQRVNRVRQVGEAGQRFGQGVKQVGQMATAAVTLPIVGTLVAAIKLAGDLEQKVANISSIKPEIDTTQVREALTLMSTRVPQSAEQLADSLYNVFSSLEVTQAEALKLVETFAQGATGAGTDAETFGTAVIGVMNAYGMKVEEAGHISDVFFNTVKRGVITGSELASNLGVVTQSAKNAGVNLDELGGLIAGVTKEGGQAAQNVNNLSNFLMKLPTKEAQKAMKGLGIATREANGEFKPVLEVLDQLRTKLGKMNEGDRAQALQKIFPDAQARTGATVLMSQLDFIKQSVDENVKSTGAAREAYEKMSTTFNTQWTLMGNTVKAILLEIGAAILPAITPVVIWLREHLGPAITFVKETFAKLSPGVKTAILVFAGLVAAAGPVLVIVGGIITAVSGLVIGIAGAAAAVGGFVILAKVLAVALIALPVILGQIIVVVGAVGLAIYGLYEAWSNNLGGIRDFTFEIWNAVQGAFQTGLAFIQELWAKYGPTIVQTASEVWEGIKSVAVPAITAVVTFARENFGILVQWVKENWPLIKQTIVTILEEIGERVQFWVGVISAFWKEHGEQIKAIVGAAWTIVKTIVQTTLKNILDGIKIVMQIINGDWSGAWKTWIGIAERMLKATGTVMSALGTLIWNSIKFVVSVLADNAVAVWDAAIKIGTNIWQGMRDSIRDGLHFVIEAAKELALSPLRIVQKILGIASPSKMFFEVGRNVGLGFVLGVTSMHAQAKDAVKKLGEPYVVSEAGDTGTPSVTTTSVQRQVTELVRINIPDKPEMASGKGAGKANAARRKVDQRDRPGYDALEKLYADIDQLAPAEEKTKSLAMAAELAKNKYDDLNPTVREAIMNAAAYYDRQKAVLDIQKMFGDATDSAREKLLQLTHPIGENATELEKFELELQIATERSPQFATAVAGMGAELDKTRAKLKQLDEQIAKRKADKVAADRAKQLKADAKDLGDAVSKMSEDAFNSLQRMGKSADTNLEKLLDKFAELKGVSLTLANLNPLQSIVASVEALPKPERLNAIGAALERIFKAAGFAKPEGMSDTEWSKLIGGLAEGADSAHQQDIGESKIRGTKTYDETLRSLNDRLTENVELTERSKLAKELETDAYKDLTQAQKESLLRRAQEVDVLLKQQEQTMRVIEAIKQYGEQAGDILGNAFDRILEGDFRGFWQEIKSGFAQLWRDIIGDLFRSGIRSAIQSIFKSVLKGVFGGGGSTGGGGGSLFGGGGGGTSGGGGGVTGFIQKLFGGGGSAASDIATPPSISSAAAGTWEGELAQLAAEDAAAPAIGAATGGGGIAASLAGMLPMLGLGVGASLGGAFFQNSRAANLVGTLAGGAVGLSAGLAGFAALGGTFGAGAMGSIAATIAGALPIIAPIAAVALIGAYFLNRNARRRQEEGIRNQATIDTRTALWQIMGAVMTDQMDGTEARSQVEELHQRWIETGNQLKDSKTRANHMATWNHFQPIIQYIEDAIAQQDTRANNRARMRPVFAGGGTSHYSQIIKVRPGEGIRYPGAADISVVQGEDRGVDSEYMYVPRGTRILSHSEMHSAEPHQHGGVVGDGGDVGRGDLNVNIEMYDNGDGTLDAKISSPGFEDKIVKIIKKARKEKKL